MTTIFGFFLLSLSVAILMTPFVAKVGRRLGALDYPDERKIHDEAIPRSGGLAIYLSFYMPFLSLLFIQTYVTDLVVWNSLSLGFWGCSSLILLVGFWDDICGLSAPRKFVMQIGVAVIAWWCGFRIDAVFLPFFGSLELSVFNLPLTVLWFVAIMNAINLIDGLDGLATGTALFASIILAIISLLRNNYLAALVFASFSGALLGFLRYNFNPASVFLGDSGSYFIGFALAALGIGTSQKSSVTVAILIPIVALGLPIMDMVLATVRRFVLGLEIFSSDKEHIHHKLLQLGYSQRRAALLFFGITILLGVVALMMENLRDDKVGLILGALAILSILGIRKLGYLEYFTADKVLGWFADVTDEAGITRDRRTFLNKQMAIHGSANIYQFWCRTIYAAEKINLDAVSLELHTDCFNGCTLPNFEWDNGNGTEDIENGSDRLLTVELPLVSNGKCYGTLCLQKVIKAGNDDRLLLRRIEHLRRTITSALERLSEDSVANPEVLEDRRSSCHMSDSELSRLADTVIWDESDRRSFWKEDIQKGSSETVSSSSSTDTGEVSPAQAGEEGAEEKASGDG
jgi:UDP-GlcNAc:undecaprenyl-phosphate GlcNAc-1-phosphate transferase